MKGAPFVGLVVSILSLCSCFRPSASDEALSLVHQHREADARTKLEAEIAKHPENLEAYRILIRVDGMLGDLPHAQKTAGLLSKKLPENDPSSEIELGHAFEFAHKFEDALEAYDRAAVRAPRSPVGPREGGMRAARWGEAEEARPRLEEAIRRGAADAEIHHVLGLVYLKLGDGTRAEASYRAGIQADVRSAENYLGLATVGVKMGHPKLALEGYDGILRLRPDFAPAALGRAWALVRLGNVRDAEAALARAEALGMPPSETANLRALVRKPVVQEPIVPEQGAPTHVIDAN